jgi:hypothetical protein
MQSPGPVFVSGSHDAKDAGIKVEQVQQMETALKAAGNTADCPDLAPFDILR